MFLCGSKAIKSIASLWPEKGGVFVEKHDFVSTPHAIYRFPIYERNVFLCLVKQAPGVVAPL